MNPTDFITLRTDQGELKVPRGTTVADALPALLERLGTASPDAVATAVNGEFVARSLRPEWALHDGDTLLCFAPITGG